MKSKAQDSKMRLISNTQFAIYMSEWQFESFLSLENDLTHGSFRQNGEFEMCFDFYKTIQAQTNWTIQYISVNTGKTRLIT